MENGLHLNGIIIKKISGPVSMYYLRPTLLNGPPILLFGDSHHSYENICEPCENNENNGNNDDCYSISDPSFITKFDECAMENMPIDLFVETHHIIMDELDYGEGILDDFIKNGIACFKKKEECLTKNIRWHYSDPRFSQSHNRLTLESMLCMPSIIYNSYVNVVKNLKREGMPTKNAFKTICEMHKYDPSNYENLSIAVRDILSSLVLCKNLKEITNTFADKFFYYMNQSTSDSIIYKQIIKSNISQDIWKKIFKVLIKNSFTFEDSVSETIIYPIQNSIGFMQEYGISNTYVNKNLEMSQLISGFLIVLFSSLLDLYVLSRMFKNPTAPHVPSCLNICYFGHQHVVSIVDVLQKAFDYEIFYAEDNYSNKKRCIEIQKSIPIESNMLDMFEAFENISKDENYSFVTKRKNVKNVKNVIKIKKSIKSKNVKKNRKSISKKNKNNKK